MRIELFQVFRNFKLKIKIFLIFFVLLLLIVDLGSLSVTSVREVQSSTSTIAEELVPRLIQTSTVKDNLNLAILSAYDYVSTGNPASKQDYKKRLQATVSAQIQLFLLSQSDADFEFTTSFETSINEIHESLEELIEAYELGASPDLIQQKLSIVSQRRDEFANFLETEIQGKVQQQTKTQQEKTADQVRSTMINVAVVAGIAFLASILLYAFIRQSITRPLQELSAVAEDIGRGKFRAVTLDSKDELGLFADTFNTMLQRIAATQESLKYELEKTKQLDRQKTEFLSIAAHQLRTPMAGIKWVVNMAVGGDFGEVPVEAKEQLGKGLQNIDRMITLINSLLDVTEIETKGFAFELKPDDVVMITKEVVDELEHFAKDTGVTIVLQMPPKPIAFAQVDKEKIKMALHNLIDNALKYTPKGGTVTVSFAEIGKQVQVIIADTGYGIPPEEQGRIFTKFYRGSNIQTVQADGSGLGLFIVYQIVSGHEGEVEFESEVGKGTTFTITLPANKSPV